MTVVLIGPPAAGKTVVGRRLAALLHEPFLDTDAALVAAHGPIPAIFERLGEPGFRELEREAVAEALRAGGVVSLGGGAPLDAVTAGRLAAHRVVLLTVEEAAAARRIRAGGRPLITDISSWRDLVARRMPVYRALAQHTADTTRLSPAEVAAQVARWIDESTPAAQEAEV